MTLVARPFDLVETLRFDPDDGLWELERHIARLGASAAAFGFQFDRHGIRNELHCATFRLREGARVRLMLSPSGATAIETSALPAPVDEPVTVALAPLPLDASDVRLRHETSDRAFYDEARRASGAFEVLFVRPDGLVTEGSFANVFVERDGALLTPAAAHGLLPGILRETLIADARAREADLRVDDLAGSFWIGDTLRGLMRARLA